MKGNVMESKIVISFSPMEALEVERVVLDRNKDEALRMIERVVLKKIRQASSPH